MYILPIIRGLRMGHFCTRGHFFTATLLHERHFSTKGHFCTASLLHAGPLLHSFTFAQRVIFARELKIYMKHKENLIKKKQEKYIKRLINKKKLPTEGKG